jgi:hypothetical protein
MAMESLEDRTLLSGGLLADAFNYPLGSFNDANLSLNNGASIVNANLSPQLGLTDAGANETRSAFYSTPVAVGRFATDFTLLDGNPNGGVTFAVQGNSANSVGSGGTGLGYGGMAKSVAVGLTTLNGGSQVELGQNGAFGTATDLTASGIDLRSGHPINVHIEYDGSTLTVTETDSTTLGAATPTSATQTYSVNIASIVGSSGYVGFTGADGAIGASQVVTGWEFADVLPTDSNINAAVASSSFGGGVYTVGAAGTGLAGASDSIHFLSRSATGDTTIIARVDSAAAGQTGLMFRDGTAANGLFAAVELSGGSAVFLSRSSVGGSVVSGGSVTASAPMYLKLVRNGNTLSGYISSTGAASSWQLVGTAGVKMADSVQVGLAAAGSGSAQFSHITVNADAPIGVDTGDAGSTWNENDQMWVDVMRQADPYLFAGQPANTSTQQIPQNPGDLANVDAKGWPTQDFSVTVLKSQINNLGTYKLSMVVGQNPTIAVAGATVSNQAYNATTKTMTADVTLSAPGLSIQITATNTNGGAKNIRLIRPGYDANNPPIFTNNYINYMKSVGPSVLRFMNFLEANNNPTRTWSQRTLPDDASQTMRLPVFNLDGSVAISTPQNKGIAWEYAIALANALHADMWINIPAQADDNYVTQLANLIKNGDTVDGVFYPGLAPDLNVYVEYGNEAWNSGFNQFIYDLQSAQQEINAGQASGNPSPLNYDNANNIEVWERRFYARRLMQMTNIFGSVFGPSAINARIRAVLATKPDFQSYADMLSFVQHIGTNPGSVFYALGTAPYMNLNGPHNTTNTLNGGYYNPNLTVDDVLANFGVNANALASDYANFGGLAAQYGMKLTAYEGGIDAGGNFQTGSDGAKAGAERDPRFVGILEHYLANWFGNGGGAFMYFTSNAQPYGFQFGDYSLTEDVTDLNSTKEIAFRDAHAAQRSPLVPLTPQGLATFSPSSTSAIVSWGGSFPTATEFRVQASTDPNFLANVVTTLAPPGVSSATVNNLQPGLTYYLRVLAANTAGTSVVSGSAPVTTSGTLTAPAAPSNVNGVALSNSEVVLNWTDHSNFESGFHIDYATDPNFTQNFKTITAPADTTSFTVFGLSGTTNYYFRVRAFDAAGESGSTIGNSAVMTLQAPAVLDYEFDETGGSTALDSVAMAPDNGSIVGGVTRVAGKTGSGALLFDGSTGYVDAGLPQKLNLTGQLTASAWIKPTSNAKQDVIIQDWDGTATPWYLRMYDNHTVAFGTYRFITFGVPPFEAKGTTAVNLTDGNWHFLAGTYDGTQFKVYVDGALVATLADPYGITRGNQPVNIGRNSNGGEGSHDYFQGTIDDVKVFSSGFSDSDIVKLMNASPTNPPPPPPPPPSGNPTVIVDDNDNGVTFSGGWFSSQSGTGYYGADYRNDGNLNKGSSSAFFPLKITTAGLYQVMDHWIAGSNEATNVPVDIITANGTVTVHVDESQTNNTWVVLGTYQLDPATAAVIIRNSATTGLVVADAVGTAPVSTTAPVAPTNLSGRAVSSSEIDLVWADNSSDEAGFKVEYSTDGANWTTAGTAAANATSFNVTGLAASTSYTFRVSAVNSAGASGFSSSGLIATLAASPTAPAAPTLLVGTAVSTSQINLTWVDNSNDEAGFLVEESTDGAHWSTVTTTGANVTAASVTGLSASTAYTFRVSAQNTAGSSGYAVSSAISTQAAQVPQAPAAPSALVATAVSSSEIDLTWSDNSNNESGFVVDKSTDGSNWTNVTTTGANATSFNVTGLAAGTAYQFRVSAINGAGASGYATAGPVSTRSAPPPPTVISDDDDPGVTYVGNWWSSQLGIGYYGGDYRNDGNQLKGSSSVTFPGRIAAAGNYTVYARWTAGSDHANNVPIDIVTTTGKVTVHVDETQNGGVWFSLGAYALDPATASVVVRNGGTSGLVVADAVEFVPVTGTAVAPAAPTNLAATAVSPSQVNLTWTVNSTNEDGFVIEVSTDNTNWSPAGGAAAQASSATVSGLAAGTSYYFRVRAFNSGGTSSNAVSAPVTTQGSGGATVISDDNDPGVIYTGNWWSSQLGTGFYGGDYRNDGNQLKGSSSAKFPARIPAFGTYSVSLRWNSGTNNASNVPVDIVTSSGTVTVVVDESRNAGTWFTLGTYTLDPSTASVTVRNTGTNGLVVADAIQFSQGALTKPAAPTALVATAASTTQVNLTWQSSSTNEAAFIVEYSSDGGNSWLSGGTAPAGATYFSVTGLSPNTTYAFRVRAFNSAGASQNATSTPVTTPMANGPTTIVDDNDPGVIFTGRWWSTQLGGVFYGSDYRNDGNQLKGGSNIKFGVPITTTGNYQVFVRTENMNGSAASNVPFDVVTAAGTTTVVVDETRNNSSWVSLGTFSLNPSTAAVIVRNDNTNGIVTADAVGVAPA